MNKIKGILLDLDNTLYDYDKVHESAMNETVRYICKISGKDEQTINNLFIKCREEVHQALCNTAASHNRVLYFQKMCEALKMDVIENVLKIYNVYWDTTLANLNMDEHTLDFMNYISKYKIALITDLTAHIQFRKLEKLGLSKYVDFVITSEEAGVEKPSKGIFDLALSKINMDYSEVVMIGDSFEKDCLGARDSGIKAFWLNRKEQTATKHENIIEVRTLGEIKEYLN